ncbi:factor of dna methylation 1 [Quercus suber]|uniref:Factor of dna methylation 1 n=1 Tax=Quercus suber TaxID=58331 RepID=A0AAW0LP13_QUESU
MKPSFRSTIHDLTNFHSPGIMVVMETCISGSRASEILRTLPYDGIHTIDLVDYARGIWLLWRGDMVDMDVLTAMEQEILAIVKVLSSPSPWLLSSIYGSPRFEERQILWDNLCSVSLLHDLPWTIVGDYDDVIDGTEKLGGKPEVIDKGDSKLKKLRSVCGEEVYKTVVDALLELNDYNSSGRYVIPKLWNFNERRKANLKELLKECVAKALEYHFLTVSSKVPSARPRLNAKWDKPPPGWYKLNTDASIINCHTGAGGLLCDLSGT